MNTTDTNFLADNQVHAMLDRLVTRYRSLISLLRSDEEAGTEAIFHFQLKIQAVEDASKRLTDGAAIDAGLYDELVQEYKSVFK